jgi:hydroxymethylpyrimidine/phosphomethylpyrimidine kinase
MLASAELVRIVADALDPAIPYVCDPVMVATSGDRLLDLEAERVILERLIPRAAVVTPNLDEAAILAGFEVRDPASMEQAGRILLELGATAALIKGGHLRGLVLVDLLVTRDGIRRFEHPRIDSRSTHGTGCTLSAAITAGLAIGQPLEAAVTTALEYVHRAIASAPGLGAGHGPVNHGA